MVLYFECRVNKKRTPSDCFLFFFGDFAHCFLPVIIFFLQLAVFEVLTEEYIPDLHAHLKKVGVLSMISLSWFLTIFIR